MRARLARFGSEVESQKEGRVSVIPRKPKGLFQVPPETAPSA
jgi:hypothetical protein